jgi:hypothetical protein
MRITTLLTVVALLGFAGQGCGSRDCVELCNEGQAGNCTSIKGNCSAFCSALDAVEGPANCTSQSDGYTDCLSQESNVCDSSCGSTESSLGSCMAVYCLLHPTDSNCKILLASF